MASAVDADVMLTRHHRQSRILHPDTACSTDPTYGSRTVIGTFGASARAQSVRLSSPIGVQSVAPLAESISSWAFLIVL